MTISNPLSWIEEHAHFGAKYDKIVEMIAELNTPTVAPAAHAHDVKYPQDGASGFDSGDLVWKLDLTNFANNEDYPRLAPQAGSYETWHAINNSMQANSTYESTGENPADSLSLCYHRNQGATGTYWNMFLTDIPKSGSMEFDFRSDANPIRGNYVRFLGYFWNRTTSLFEEWELFFQQILSGLEVGTSAGIIKNQSWSANTWYNIKFKWQYPKGIAGNNRGRVNGAIDDVWGTEQYMGVTAENTELHWTGLFRVFFAFNNSSSSYYMDTFYDNWTIRVNPFDLG